jgi:hypothetical protein
MQEPPPAGATAENPPAPDGEMYFVLHRQNMLSIAEVAIRLAEQEMLVEARMLVDLVWEAVELTDEFRKGSPQDGGDSGWRPRSVS